MALGASPNASHATKRADRRAYAWRAPGRGASRATARFVVECPPRRAAPSAPPPRKRRILDRCASHGALRGRPNAPPNASAHHAPRAHSGRPRRVHTRGLPLLLLDAQPQTSVLSTSTDLEFSTPLTLGLRSLLLDTRSQTPVPPKSVARSESREIVTSPAASRSLTSLNPRPRSAYPPLRSMAPDPRPPRLPKSTARAESREIPTSRISDLASISRSAPRPRLKWQRRP